MPMPSTSLASQLAQLSGGAQLHLLKKNIPSLLFDKKKAAQLDKDDLLSIGKLGLDDLISMSPAHFKEFESTLFSDKMKAKDRTLMVI
jgi:hypothetical protein